MIEKLVANRFLALPRFDQSPPPPDPTFPAHFVRALGRIYNIEESESSGPFYNRAKTSQVSVGAHGTKAHRTFRWLPWVLGKVSCVPLAGADILTGLMTSPPCRLDKSSCHLHRKVWPSRPCTRP